MQTEGIDFIAEMSKKDHFTAKLVFNDKGAIFFPASTQHRDMKGPSVSYEDNYKGNALAAMISPGRIEVRFHQSFPDARVAEIIRDLLAQTGLEFMDGWQVTYQGRKLAI